MIYSGVPHPARFSVSEKPCRMGDSCKMGPLIFKVFFIIFYVPKDILQKKVCKLFIFQGFCVELIQIRPFFTTFGRIMTISGQMHVLFDVHFSDFPETCIPGYLHILAQKPCIPGYTCIPGYRTVYYC